MTLTEPIWQIRYLHLGTVYSTVVTAPTHAQAVARFRREHRHVEVVP